MCRSISYVKIGISQSPILTADVHDISLLVSLLLIPGVWPLTTLQAYFFLEFECMSLFNVNPINHPTVFNLVFWLKYTRWVEMGVAGNVATSKVEKSQFQRMLSTVWESRAECNFRTSHKPTMPSSPMYKDKQEFFSNLQKQAGFFSSSPVCSSSQTTSRKTKNKTNQSLRFTSHGLKSWQQGPLGMLVFWIE